MLTIKWYIHTVRIGGKSSKSDSITIDSSTFVTIITVFGVLILLFCILIACFIMWFVKRQQDQSQASMNKFLEKQASNHNRNQGDKELALATATNTLNVPTTSGIELQKVSSNSIMGNGLSPAPVLNLNISSTNDGGELVEGSGISKGGRDVNVKIGDIEGKNDGTNAHETDDNNVIIVNNKKLELHSNWNVWDENDISEWIRSELVNAKFSEDKISQFMIEFDQIDMTGNVLQQWLNESNGSSDALLEKFQKSVSFNPKSIIWQVVIQAVMNL